MPRIHCADNLEVLHGIDELSIPLCYIDPPFNTGKTRRYRRLKTIADEHGAEALQVMAKRFAHVPDLEWQGFDPRENA